MTRSSRSTMLAGPSLSVRAMALFLMILVLVSILGAGFFWYQRTLFDPKAYNEQLMVRALNTARLLSTARPDSRRLRPFQRSDSTLMIVIEPDFEDDDIVVRERAPREVRQFSTMLEGRLKNAPLPPSRRNGRAQRPGQRPGQRLGAGLREQQQINRGTRLNGGSPPRRLAPPSYTFAVDIVRTTPNLFDALMPDDDDDFSQLRQTSRSEGGEDRFRAVRSFAVLVRARSDDGVDYAMLMRPFFRNVGMTLLLVGAFFAALVSTAGLAAYSMMRVTQPLDRLARATRHFGQTLEPVEIAGPRAGEVGAAIEAFTTMQGQVRQLLDDRTQITGAVSHDLRTYLTRFRLRAELLSGDSANAMIVEKTIADVNEMEAILESSLAYSKFSLREAAALNKSSFDLANFLKRLLAARTDSEAVALSVPEEPVVVIEADQTALRRVINNLIDNAFAYASNPSISVQQSEQWVEIEILDEGPGLDAETRAAMLRPYARGESSRNRKTGGTGLGLAISNDIVAAHGGKLRFEARNDGKIGSSVAVRLPLNTTASSQPIR